MVSFLLPYLYTKDRQTEVIHGAGRREKTEREYRVDAPYKSMEHWNPRELASQELLNNDDEQ